MMRTYERRNLVAQHDRGGFTLLEILIVLAIIGVIAAMAVPRLLGQQRSANVKISKQAIHSLEQNLDIYATGNNGEYPQGGQEALAVLLEMGADGSEPLYDKVPADAWNEALFYEYPSTKTTSNRPAIWSAGQNRQNENGSGDDINNWDDQTQ
ncbi:MAG: type II secretion system protein GspG [Planctomycetaceae bacterium]|nr:type II secretion system protein GspG [Planctomycetaceae bacterium]